MRLFLLLSYVISTLTVAVVSCSESNPVIDTVSNPQERVLDTAENNQESVIDATENNKLALLSLSQGFNDLEQYVIDGRIKNLLYNEEITSITIRVSLYTSDETLIAQNDDRIYSMRSREEATFETVTWQWQFELDDLTPDSDKTVITMLINGTIVSYEDRRGESGSDTAGRYDFRWSRWGDSKDLVESKEPGTLTFTRDEGMDETGITTDILTFSETIFDTVDVKYRFMGNELWGGRYVFSSSVSDSLKDALSSTLNDQYGISSEVDGNTVWKRNEDTFIVLYPESTDTSMLLDYYEKSMYNNLDGNNAYNALPVRKVVPE